MKSLFVCICLLSLSVFADQIGNVASRQLGASFYTKVTKADSESGLLVCPFEPTSGKISNATRYIAYVTPKTKRIAGIEVTLKKIPGFNTEQLINAMRKKYRYMDMTGRDVKKQRILQEKSGKFGFALRRADRFFFDETTQRVILLLDDSSTVTLFYIDVPTYEQGEKEASKVNVSGL